MIMEKWWLSWIPYNRDEKQDHSIVFKNVFFSLELEYFDAFTAQIQCTPFYPHLTMYLERVTMTDRQQ